MEMKIYLKENMEVYADYKGYVIKTDQPEKDGGTGEYPAPFDLFLASIGTCAGLYVYRFCQQRDISTEGIEVILSTKRDPEKAMIGAIDIDIRLPENFPDKYRDAVIRSADLCAVKKHILDPPEMTVTASK